MMLHDADTVEVGTLGGSGFLGKKNRTRGVVRGYKYRIGVVLGVVGGNGYALRSDGDDPEDQHFYVLRSDTQPTHITYYDPATVSPTISLQIQ